MNNRSREVEIHLEPVRPPFDGMLGLLGFAFLALAAADAVLVLVSLTPAAPLAALILDGLGLVEGDTWDDLFAFLVLVWLAPSSAAAGGGLLWIRRWARNRGSESTSVPGRRHAPLHLLRASCFALAAISALLVVLIFTPAEKLIAFTFRAVGLVNQNGWDRLFALLVLLILTATWAVAGGLLLGIRAGRHQE